MRRLILVIFLLSFVSLAKAQSYIYQYVDPCTKNIKFISVPLSGANVAVTYYGQVGTFANADFSNGNFISWNSEKVRTQIEGVLTPLPIDDAFKITGGARGQVKRDTTLVGWNATIVEPLIRRNNCRWIVKGSVRTVRENTNTGTRYVGLIDYGTGTCDNIATVTINGVTYTITLP